MPLPFSRLREKGLLLAGPWAKAAEIGGGVDEASSP
jgi:hypothetical protein